MARPFLSVIIPVANGIDRLPFTLVDIDRHLARAEYAYEIIAVNDGSTDGTETLLERIAPYVPHMKYLHTVERRGAGNAVATGMTAARGTWRLVVRPDNAVSIVEFEKCMAAIMERSADVMVGSRRARGGRERGATLLRRFRERGLALVAERLLRLPVRDPFSEFFCMNADAAAAAFDAPLSRSPAYAIEAFHRAARAGFTIRELPVSLTHSRRTAPLADLRILRDIITIRLRRGRGSVSA